MEAARGRRTSANTQPHGRTKTKIRLGEAEDFGWMAMAAQPDLRTEHRLGQDT